MSWNEVKKQTPKTGNIPTERDDLTDIGKESMFSALSNMEDKENKKNNNVNNNNNGNNKSMKPNRSSDSISSQKSDKKKQSSASSTEQAAAAAAAAAAKMTPISHLSKLNLSSFISQNISINNNEQNQIDQLKKLCNFIETDITNRLFCATTKFSHKSFDIDNQDFKGPINYLSSKQKKEIENVFSKCNESVIKKLFVLVIRCIFVGEKKAVNSPNISNTIAHQICVQIISELYPGILYRNGKSNKYVYEQILSQHKNLIDKLPAIGNTSIWVCNQQEYSVGKKNIKCPEYIELWMEYFLDALSSLDASVSIQMQSVKLLNKVLDDLKENKSKINARVQVSLDSFIKLLVTLTSSEILSQLKKRGQLYNGVLKAYNSLKELLFDSTNVFINFDVSDIDMFVRLYKLLSNPSYEKETYQEIVRVITLALSKDSALFETWESIYGQYQGNNIKFANDIVIEIKNHQTIYLKNKKHVPQNINWKELENDQLRSTLCSIQDINKSYSKKFKTNIQEINEMNKNIKAILNKMTRRKSGGGIFSLFKKIILFILILSLGLHIVDTVGDEMKSDIKSMPAGHPPIPIQGADITKCPFNNFRNSYSKCKKCHPIIKYSYDLMDTPYQYLSKNVVIPVYRNIWNPYCSPVFMSTLRNVIIPSYKVVKPIVYDSTKEQIQNNIAPKVKNVYDTYAKSYVDVANEKVIVPVIAISSKYYGEVSKIMKPILVNTYDFIVYDVVKPSLPYLEIAKNKAIQYGNKFLDVLADIPYRTILFKTIRCITKMAEVVENFLKNVYDFLSPYLSKYWSVLTRKFEVLIEQESVQKIINHPYTKMTVSAIRETFKIWCDGIKISYAYITKRGPKHVGAKNWNEAISRISIYDDVMLCIRTTEKFINSLIEKLNDNNEFSTNQGKQQQHHSSKSNDEEKIENLKKEKKQEKLAKETEVPSQKEKTSTTSSTTKTSTSTKNASSESPASSSTTTATKSNNNEEEEKVSPRKTIQKSKSTVEASSSTKSKSTSKIPPTAEEQAKRKAARTSKALPKEYQSSKTILKTEENKAAPKSKTQLPPKSNTEKENQKKESSKDEL